MYFINQTTLPALTLQRKTNIPVAESYQDDHYNTWARCPRCGRYHMHTAKEYTQGILAAKCEDGDPLAKADVPALYFIFIDGLVGPTEVRDFLRFTAKRKHESDAIRKSRAKEEARRARLKLCGRSLTSTKQP